MTRDEAKEVGLLAAALDEVGEMIAAIEAAPDYDIEVTAFHREGDAGGSGIASGVEVPAALALRVFQHLEAMIEDRLHALGVRP